MTTVREERRLVTCMFVDVVGSTELVTRMGAERLKRELGNAFAEISAVIRAHGGTVEKYIGDAVYALFGAPVAHEDDPLRALRAAQALREWCAAGAAHGHPFAIRVGMETGEAVIDLEAAETTKQQMSVGPVVNIAARLQQRAEPGEILIGPVLRTATEGCAEVEAIGDAELKGIGRLPTWRVVSVATAAPARPSLPFVGREAELGVLSLAYERARKGRSVLTVVSGPPGQGKTRLVQEFLRRREDDVVLIPTRCRPAEEVGAFAPVREILGVTTLDELAVRVRQMCGDEIECQRVVAGLAESAGIATSASLASLAAAEREDEIVQAWRRYVAMLGIDRLVVLAVDDIHWADPSLIRLVDRLTFGGPRLLLIATARPEFAEAAGIRPSGDRFFIDLEGLEREDAVILAREAGADDERVIERAEGNPLFLVELARAGTDGAELPLTLQGALGARLDQLPMPERLLLSLAAVVGERFSAADAAFLSQRDLIETGRTLSRLADLHFLDLTDAGYRFHHGLVRDAAYGRLLTAERMRAHARFARERVHPEDAEALAYHWWEALRPPDGEWVWSGAPDLPTMRREAFGALLADARIHGDHFAVDEAIEWSTRSLSFASDDRQRALVHHARARGYHRVLREDEAWADLMRARELYRASGGVPLDLYVDAAEAIEYYGAFKALPPSEHLLTVMEEGAAEARAVGDMGVLALVRAAHARYAAGRGPSASGDDRAATGEAAAGRVASYIDEAADAAEKSGDARILRRVLHLKIELLTFRGRFDEIRPLIAELESATPDADALVRLRAAMARASYYVVIADRTANEDAVSDALRLAEPMGPHNQTHAWQQAVEMYSARGEWDKVLEYAHRTAALVRERTGAAFCELSARNLRDGAVAHALAGERDDALALLDLITLTTDPQPELRASLARSMLGLASPRADEILAVKGEGWWWNWLLAAVRAVIAGDADDAERALGHVPDAALGAAMLGALVDGVREATNELRGGPPATYQALRRIGYHGWIDILKRRIDAEY
jgi:class 3 adenylate cyclase